MTRGGQSSASGGGVRIVHVESRVMTLETFRVAGGHLGHPNSKAYPSGRGEKSGCLPCSSNYTNTGLATEYRSVCKTRVLSAHSQGAAGMLVELQLRGGIRTDGIIHPIHISRSGAIHLDLVYHSSLYSSVLGGRPPPGPRPKPWDLHVSLMARPCSSACLTQSDAGGVA